MQKRIEHHVKFKCNDIWVAHWVNYILFTLRLLYAREITRKNKRFCCSGSDLYTEMQIICGRESVVIYDCIVYTLAIRGCPFCALNRISLRCNTANDTVIPSCPAQRY